MGEIGPRHMLMNTIESRNENESSSILLRMFIRAGLGLATLLTLAACDTEALGPDDESDSFVVEPGEDQGFRAGGCNLPPIPEHDEVGPGSADWCNTLRVRVNGPGAEFVNGDYVWTTNRGYSLDKKWEHFTYHNRIRPSCQLPDNWAVIYEGFSRDGEHQPCTAHTEVAVAASPGGLPQKASWPDNVTVSCVN